MAKTMAEVLAEHPEPEVDGGYWYCPCGHDYGVTFGCAAVAAHQAAALSAAGYGLVADAKRGAWERCINHVLVSCTYVTATAEPWRHKRLISDLNEVKDANPYRKASNDDQ